jgi:two-component system NtrC family sensor kinase
MPDPARHALRVPGLLLMIRSTSLLIVDGNRESAGRLAAEAAARAYRVRVVRSVVEALAAVAQEAVDALLVDPGPGTAGAFDLLARLRRMESDAEVIVMSDTVSMAAAIQWFDPDDLAFVRKSDVIELFAVLGRALERRRITLQNRRLVWELQTINQIATGLTTSLELEDVVTGALQRLVPAMGAAGGAIRLRDESTKRFDNITVVGPSSVAAALGASRASDDALATRAAVIVEDFAQVAGEAGGPRPAVRCAISLPMFAGEELLGTLSLAAAHPRRFAVADQQLLTIIAGQIAVAAQNARLHRSILRAKREWEQTFDAINDPIAVFNGRGQLLRGNHALAQLLSKPITAIQGLSCSEAGFCDEGPGGCAVSRALARGEIRSEVTLPEGQIFSVTTFPIGVPSDGPSVVQIAQNVTEEIRTARRVQQMSGELAATNQRLVTALHQLKATQAQLVQAEKLSAIGQLVAGVAHELNNPLTSVIGYAQLVEEELRDGSSRRPPGQVAHDLRRIAEESERAARIVRNLLVFARRQSTDRGPQSVPDICSRVLALREYEFRLRGVKVETDLPADLPRVVADAGQLQQVFLNLVLNAERAMRGRDDPRLSVAARHEEGASAIEVAVTDSGHGIDESNISRIFDPFFTTRDVGEGTGLGLSICYGIVRDHGGEIRVESRVGTGTTFRVTLPASVDTASRGMEVLIAHPDQTERALLVAMMAGWGYRPVAAATGQEALEIYRRATLQLAIVDRATVAADLAGWRALRDADRRRQLPLVITSVPPGDQVTERFGRDEGAAVLGPPVELRALQAAIRAGVKECV